MTMMKFSFTICGLLLMMIANAWAAEDKIKNSSFGYEILLDSEKNRDSTFNLTHFVDEVHQLSLVYSKSYVQGDASLGVSDYQSRGYTVAIENLGDTLINTGWEYENWGKPDDLNIHSLRTLIALNGKSTRLELHPQMQKIRFENVNTRIAALTKIDFNSMGAGLNLTLMLGENWFLDLEYFENTYYTSFQNFQTALENAECKLRYSTHLSNAANSLAATLDDSRKGARVGWQKKNGSISAHYQRAHSFISACDTDQGGVTAAIDVNDSWSVNLSVGRSDSSISERINFVTMGLNARF